MNERLGQLKHEVLQVADAVAREKNIERDLVIEAMEEAIQKAGLARYGINYDIRARIDRRTGSIALERFMEVVEAVEDDYKEISLQNARKSQSNIEIGQHIIEELPPINFGRVAAQSAKQIITQKIHDAERAKQYEEFQDRVGEIMNVIVKRVEHQGVFVDLGRSEALIRRRELIPRERFKNGDRIRAYIYDVKRADTGPQIFLSRTHPDFMKELFKQEVPEIYDGIIEVRAVTRDPGSRAKIAVFSNDSGLDPVGTTVGVRGSRVQAVTHELQGERIDVIQWSGDIGQFIVSSLKPSRVTKVVVDEDKNRADVVVPDEDLSLAIGRSGQNIRLASRLVGWTLDVMTEEEESKRRAEEFATKSQHFIAALDIDDMIAHLLIAEGFSHVNEIAATSVSEIANIDGFDEDIAVELINRSQEWINAQEKEFLDKKKELGLADDLETLPYLSKEMLIKLGQEKICSADDIGDLATDELLEITEGLGLTRKQADEIIMQARQSWFDVSDTFEKDGESSETTDNGDKEA